jgi:hypothetical protein
MSRNFFRWAGCTCGPRAWIQAGSHATAANWRVDGFGWCVFKNFAMTWLRCSVLTLRDWDVDEIARTIFHRTSKFVFLIDYDPERNGAHCPIALSHVLKDTAASAAKGESIL